MRQRPTRTQDEDYLEWVRSMPCAVCMADPPNDPHHLTSKGAGGSDRTCIPMCRKCHRTYHAVGHDHFEATRNVNLWKQAHRHLRYYIQQELESLCQQ